MFHCLFITSQILFHLPSLLISICVEAEVNIYMFFSPSQIRGVHQSCTCLMSHLAFSAHKPETWVIDFCCWSLIELWRYLSLGKNCKDDRWTEVKGTENKNLKKQKHTKWKCTAQIMHAYELVSQYENKAMLLFPACVTRIRSLIKISRLQNWDRLIFSNIRLAPAPSGHPFSVMVQLL